MNCGYGVDRGVPGWRRVLTVSRRVLTIQGLKAGRGREITGMTIKNPEGVFSNSVGHRPVVVGRNFGPYYPRSFSPLFMELAN
jgi:hypothetical protein